MALAQVTACGSCVKDDPPPPVGAAGDRRPIDLRAADKRLSQFSDTAQLGADARAQAQASESDSGAADAARD